MRFRHPVAEHDDPRSLRVGEAPQLNATFNAGGSNNAPDTRGYTVQVEYVPLDKMESWGRPWVNLRVGLQYTRYLRFNGGTSNYDGFGRSASQNNSLFLFSWMAF